MSRELISQINKSKGQCLKGVCLLVTNIDAPTGGVQKNSRILLNELVRRGVNTYVCTRNYSGLQRKEVQGGTVFLRSPIVRQSLAITSVVYILDVLVWLIRNRAKYDVIHCQQMFGPSMAAAVASLFLRKPIVTRLTLSGQGGEVREIRRLPFSKLRQLLLKRVDRWVVLSEEMKEELAAFGAARATIKIIYNSTELPPHPAYLPGVAEQQREKLGLPSGKMAVFVGRLAQEKNLDVLVSAWSKILKAEPGANLFLVGGGGEYRNAEPQLKNLVRDLALTNAVHFVGHTSHVKDFVLAADLFVLPSGAEGMSNALVEAFACGAAIVATDIPANTELCVHNQNAITVPVRDESALAAAILELFASPELRNRLGCAARRKAEKDLSIDRMVSSYLDVYREMLARSD